MKSASPIDLARHFLELSAGGRQAPSEADATMKSAMLSYALFRMNLEL